MGREGVGGEHEEGRGVRGRGRNRGREEGGGGEVK